MDKLLQHKDESENGDMSFPPYNHIIREIYYYNSKVECN